MLLIFKSIDGNESRGVYKTEDGYWVEVIKTQSRGHVIRHDTYSMGETFNLISHAYIILNCLFPHVRHNKFDNHDVSKFLKDHKQQIDEGYTKILTQQWQYPEFITTAGDQPKLEDIYYSQTHRDGKHKGDYLCDMFLVMNHPSSNNNCVVVGDKDNHPSSNNNCVVVGDKDNHPSSNNNCVVVGDNDPLGPWYDDLLYDI